MALEHDKIKGWFDTDYSHNTATREMASDDLVFYHVTQWDDNALTESQLQYRGQFDVLRKAGRHILSGLRANPVQIDFEPVDESRQDGADLIDGLYRSDDRSNSSQESYDMASQESVVCGYGAWRLTTEYVSMRSGDTKQVIKRKPIYEANNKCFFDSNAKMLDKSDAQRVSVLHAYSEDGYKLLRQELTGEDYDDEINESSFSTPETSFVFPWITQSHNIYVVEFYHTEKVKGKVIKLKDIFDNEVTLSEEDFEDQMDDLIDTGYTVESEKEVERNQVTLYICSGERILNGDGKGEVIAGEYIPVVPVYGERGYVEDEEYYEGITRLAKDPQRLRNFQLSYLADIVSRSPRQVPIYLPEQLQGYEPMYSESGAESNFPYKLQHSKDVNGNPLPLGPVGVTPEQPIPSALIQSIEVTRAAIQDVADPGIPQDFSDPDMSGKAIHALQSRIDQQAQIYQDNLKHAKRRDAEIYASMAVDIHSEPEEVTITLADGKRKTVSVMSQEINEKGELVVANDLTNQEFDVYAEIGPSYQTQKEQTIDRITMMIGTMGPEDPMRNALMLKLISMTDGTDFNDIRDYANNQMILGGFKEPETDEEKQMVQEAQQSQQPDAMTIAAMAEKDKAQADLMNAQTSQMSAQSDMQVSAAETQIKAFDSETKRMQVQVDAQEAGAVIKLKEIEQFNKRVQDENKMNLERGKATVQSFAQLRGRAG